MIICSEVIGYSDEMMGSFRNVRLLGQANLITIGIGPNHTYPQIGQKIKVRGERRNGRFLTIDWEYAGESVICSICGEPLEELGYKHPRRECRNMRCKIGVQNLASNHDESVAQSFGLRGNSNHDK